MLGYIEDSNSASATPTTNAIDVFFCCLIVRTSQGYPNVKSKAQRKTELKKSQSKYKTIYVSYDTSYHLV